MPIIQWTYETGRFESEILGSGGTYYHVLRTKDERHAREQAVSPRNYLIRYFYTEDKRKITQEWDGHTNTWFGDDIPENMQDTTSYTNDKDWTYCGDHSNYPTDDGFYLASLSEQIHHGDQNLAVVKCWFNSKTNSFSDYGDFVIAWMPMPPYYRNPKL